MGLLVAEASASLVEGGVDVVGSDFKMLSIEKGLFGLDEGGTVLALLVCVGIEISFCS